MPIYEYHCNKCHADFELKRSFSESDRAAPCPRCGSPGEKLVSACCTDADYRIRYPARDPLRKTAEEEKAP